MSDLMLLGVLRAPTPEPDNILGIHQLADRARQAADALEAKDKRIAELDGKAAAYYELIEGYRDCVDARDKRIAELVDVRARYREANENDNATMRRQAGRIEELEVELDNERARGIHSCGPHCQKVECVSRRRIAELDAEVISAKCGAFRAGYFSGAIDKGFFVEVDEDTAMTSFDRWVDKDCPKPNTPVSDKQEGDT